MISLIALVIENDEETVIGVRRTRASSRISSGDQSAEYLISNRLSVRSTGAPVVPLDVMIHPELVRASVTCSRPSCVFRTNTANTASPGCGSAGCAEAAAAAQTTSAEARAVQ